MGDEILPFPESSGTTIRFPKPKATSRETGGAYNGRLGQERSQEQIVMGDKDR